MESSQSKIAFVTDDGTTISSHFGRALYYEVLTIEKGAISRRERREKAGHHSFGGEQAHDHDHKHGLMTQPIQDCHVLIARGMGTGAHNHLTAIGIQPVLTDLHTIDEAIAAYIAGSLADNPKRLHDHGSGHSHA
jgi:predicted Fe-Mo cluster-binding NifX family protein